MDQTKTIRGTDVLTPCASKDYAVQLASHILYVRNCSRFVEENICEMSTLFLFARKRSQISSQSNLSAWARASLF